MPWQLIYTSAPRGLLSGQSGFCTVARSADLREALVQRLEQISSYHYLRVSEAATANRNPTISAFRLLDLRGAKYYVLTRIQPCGLDFTARTNHLAHHLVFQADELAMLPSPAAILRHWPGWLASWQGEPRWLEELAPAEFASAAKSVLPAQAWARLTGDGGRAAGLLESECVRGCYLVCPPGSEEQVLEMFGETLQLLNFNGQFPLRPWRHTFTAFLQAEDNPNDFQWRGCQENTPAYKQAVTRSAPLIPLRSVRVPANSLVKLAREEPKPPPAPTPPPSTPAPPAQVASRKKLSLRKTSARTPLAGSVEVKQPALAPKPNWRVVDFSIHSATLTRVGIFVAVLAVLLLVKHYAANRPVGQGSPAPVSSPKPSLVVAPPPAASAPKSSPPVRAAPDANQLDCLAGDGPTYILAVPNLNNFSLPIGSISAFQNLLHRYDRQDQGALPNDIRLEANTDRWDFRPGSLMRVGGWKPRQFSASLGVSECVFDYSDWMEGKWTWLAVRDNFDSATRAFSIHFGFYSPTNGDPFRLLIVNENNPPPPLPLAKQFIRDGRQDLRASLEGSLRDCLLTNFELLAGRQWQLQPFIKPASRPAQSLYKDWPDSDRPLFGCELDYAHISQRLQARRQDLKKRLDDLSQFLGRPLGRCLGAADDNLKSFLTFVPGHLTPGGFLEYLGALKNSTPDKSWMRQWHNRPDSDQPEEVSGNLQELYDLWIQKQPTNQPMLTVTNQSGTTNYFFAAWRYLNENLKELESTQDQLDNVQKRLVELGQVAYIGLLIVDPNQPGGGLEMIRFEGR
jgi:hypothetical protein